VLKDEQQRLTLCLKATKGEMSLAFSEQRALDEELNRERPKETELLHEMASLRRLLNQRLKLLGKMETDSHETVNGYEKMAGELADKLQRHQAQHEQDTQAFVESLEQQASALSEAETLVRERHEEASALRQEFSDRATNTGERSIAESIAKLRGAVGHRPSAKFVH